jgi:predicted RND superfamily exporter protein
LLLGSGIDFGIYIINIARQSRMSGEGSEELSSGFGASIHALTISALTNALAYGSLMFTSTPAIQSLGRMLSVSMVCCLAATVFLLVPILVSRSRSRERRAQAIMTFDREGAAP